MYVVVYRWHQYTKLALEASRHRFLPLPGTGKRTARLADQSRQDVPWYMFLIFVCKNVGGIDWYVRPAGKSVPG